MKLKAAALALLLLATPAGAASIADAQKAYDAGDFATAFTDVQPLAEAGDVAEEDAGAAGRAGSLHDDLARHRNSWSRTIARLQHGKLDLANL